MLETFFFFLLGGDVEDDLIHTLDSIKVQSPGKHNDNEIQQTNSNSS